MLSVPAVPLMTSPAPGSTLTPPQAPRVHHEAPKLSTGLCLSTHDLLLVTFPHEPREFAFGWPSGILPFHYSATSGCSLISSLCFHVHEQCCLTMYPHAPCVLLTLSDCDLNQLLCGLLRKWTGGCGRVTHSHWTTGMHTDGIAR